MSRRNYHCYSLPVVATTDQTVSQHGRARQAKKKIMSYITLSTPDSLSHFTTSKYGQFGQCIIDLPGNLHSTHGQGCEFSLVLNVPSALCSIQLHNQRYKGAPSSR